MYRFLHLVRRVWCSIVLLMVLFGFFCIKPITGVAAVTPTITYQARLADADGNPLANGAYSVKLSIYDSTGSAATPLWTAAGSVGSPSAISITVTSSLLSVELGDVEGGQNSLSGVDWDQTALYLGITIGSDSEMAPRRRITAVPQALQADNAGRLQGMYASSTAASGSSLFTIHQTQSDGASATRTALEVRSAGTNSAFDYLFRGVNDVGTTVFSLNRAGAVTTTGSLYVGGSSASSTILGNVLLGTSTRDMVFPSTFLMNGDDVLVGGQLGVATSVMALGGVYAGTGTYYGDNAVNVTTGSWDVSASGNITVSSNSGVSRLYLDTWFASIISPGDIRFTVPGGSAVRPTTDLTQLGTSTERFNGYFGTVTTTNIIATTVSSTNITAGAVTTTGALYVGGSSASSTILGNVLLGTSTRDMVFPSTFLMNGDDVLVGGQLGVASSVHALGTVYVGSNTFYQDNRITVTSDGGSGSGALDINTAGNVTISSNAGLGSLGFTSSYIGLSSPGDIRFTVPGGSAVRPTTDLTQLGTSTERFNGYFGYVTTTQILATSVTSTYVTSTIVSAATVNASEVSASTSVNTSGLTVNNTADLYGAINSGVASSLVVSTVGTLGLPYSATATNMQVVGDVLFAQTTSGVVMVDISDPTAAKTIGSIDTGGTIGGFAVQSGRIYVVYDAGGNRTFAAYQYSVDGWISSISSVNLPQLTQVGGGVDVLPGNQAVYVVGNYDMAILAIDVRTVTSMAVKMSVTLSDRPVRSRLFEDAIISVMDVSGASELHRTSVEDPLTLSNYGLWLTIGDGATDFYIRGRTMYVSLSTANQVAVIDMTDSVAVLRNTLTGVTGASRVFDNGGRLFAYGTGLTGYIIYNSTSSTAPSALGTVVFGDTILSFAQKGDILILGANAANSLSFVRLPGITVNSLRGGTGSFFSLDTAGNLQVGRDANIGHRLSVGYGGLSVAGAASVSGYAATGSVLSVTNQAAGSEHKSWGAFTNRLLVGDNANATGTNSYVSLFAYDSALSRFGICLDNTNSASTCIDFASTSTVYSLLADDAIGANAFDLAERYQVSGEAEPGDVLVIDPETPFHMKKSSGIPYEPTLSGVVSTRPGFLLGTGGDVSVALVGRVPVKVSTVNGTIEVGDPLTSSEVPGVAMKATRAGRIIGRALESADEGGVIEVYLQPGFDASTLLRADGSMTTIAQDVGVRAVGVATVEAPTFNSQTLSFSGSAWDGETAVASEFRLFNQVLSATSSALTVTNNSSTLFAIDAGGSASIAGDLLLSGRLYPSARGQAQQESYIFVDDTAETGRYISTNADGWQSQDGYDYAERYVSPDELEPGDIVSVKRGSRLYVQRTLRAEDMVVGIVSTKPGFIAGRMQEDAYPIALAGRVPTKVSTMNGAIEAGDALAPSTIPGVAVKAISAGPTIGLALEDYSGSDVGKIEVFVNPGWWGGDTSFANDTGESVAGAVARSGFAQIVVGQSRIRVNLDGFIYYPLLQVTPYTQIESGWWIDRVSPEGFDIVLGAPIGRAARFAWTAEEVSESPTVLLSSGSRFSMDPISGEIQFPPSQDETTTPASPPATESVPEPEPEPEPEINSEEAPIQTVDTSTDPVPTASVEEAVPNTSIPEPSLTTDQVTPESPPVSPTEVEPSAVSTGGPTEEAPASTE